MRRQLLAEPVQVAHGLVQTLVVLLKIQCLVEMVHTQHILWVFDGVEGDEALEAWLGPQGHRVQRIARIVKDKVLPGLQGGRKQVSQWPIPLKSFQTHFNVYVFDKHKLSTVDHNLINPNPC